MTFQELQDTTKFIQKVPACGKKNSVFLLIFVILRFVSVCFFGQDGYLVRYVQQIRWWFQMFLTFTLNLGGDDPIWPNWYFSTGGNQPASSNAWTSVEGKKSFNLRGPCQTCKKIREQKTKTFGAQIFEVEFFSSWWAWAAVQVSRCFFLGGHNTAINTERFQEWDVLWFFGWVFCPILGLFLLERCLNVLENVEVLWSFSEGP